MKSEMKFIKCLMVMVAIGLLFVAYGHWLTKTVREDTIKSAVLVESNEYYYTISFDGEEHIYDSKNFDLEVII